MTNNTSWIRTGRASIDGSDPLGQENHDFIKATKTAIRAISVEAKPTSRSYALAETLYLAALLDIAAGKRDMAIPHLRIIAGRFPDFDPRTSFGRDVPIPRAGYIGEEISHFRANHLRFDYEAAYRLFEETKKHSPTGSLI